MEAEGKGLSSSSACAMTLDNLKVTQVPSCYVLPPSECPNTSDDKLSNTLPIINISSLHDPSVRSDTIDEIQKACKEIGIFQVINHGIQLSKMKDALDTATEFFDLPVEEKMLLASDNVHEPVRYGTSLNIAKENVHYWRDFIKLYAHPISNWIHLWPSNPPNYKEKMGNYVKEVQELQIQLMEAVLESLGLNSDYLKEEIGGGSQVAAVNCYPACPEPDLALGMPPHSDYGSLTILLQSCPGLQIMDHNKNWLSVPVVEGALLVQVGDQIEVMSNGEYKSVVHRVTLGKEKKRFSIACLHSLALDEKMGPAPKLVDGQHPVSYKKFSFREFLDYLSSNDFTKRRFIDTLKINP